jgi:hypothetical protein
LPIGAFSEIWQDPIRRIWEEVGWSRERQAFKHGPRSQFELLTVAKFPFGLEPELYLSPYRSVVFFPDFPGALPNFLFVGTPSLSQNSELLWSGTDADIRGAEGLAGAATAAAPVTSS